MEQIHVLLTVLFGGILLNAMCSAQQAGARTVVMVALTLPSRELGSWHASPCPVAQPGTEHLVPTPAAASAELKLWLVGPG